MRTTCCAIQRWVKPSVNLYLCCPALTKSHSPKACYTTEVTYVCLYTGKLRVHVCVGTGTHNICSITRSGRGSHSTRQLSCKSGCATAGSPWLLGDNLKPCTVTSLCCQHFYDNIYILPSALVFLPNILLNAISLPSHTYRIEPNVCYPIDSCKLALQYARLGTGLWRQMH